MATRALHTFPDSPIPTLNLRFAPHTFANASQPHKVGEGVGAHLVLGFVGELEGLDVLVLLLRMLRVELLLVVERDRLARVRLGVELAEPAGGDGKGKRDVARR